MSDWLKIVSDHQSELIGWEKDLFAMPELGFKEQRTKAYLLDLFRELNVQIEDFGLCGFSVSIGQGKPHIGLIAEMDALVVPNHFMASSIDGAAHACGHHLQSAIMAAVMRLLYKQKTVTQGKVTCYFIAAEEYVDLDARKQLRDQGKISLLSGKQNLIVENRFDDVDVLISCHTMGATDRPKMEINSMLSGFVYKKYTFVGKSSHAAVAPHLGVNALSAMALAQSAIGLLRETFREEDLIRVHLMSTLGGQSVNAVPAKTVLEGYVRSIDTNILTQVSEKIDHTVSHSAQALFAQVEIESTPGYFPLKQSEELSDVLRPFMVECVGENIVNHQKSFAAGDIGDCSLFVPTVQFGFSGCKGVVHGADFCMDNPTEALVYPVAVTLNSVQKLLTDVETLRNIKDKFKPLMTIEQYKQFHGV
ncbi:MAG: amidohydrolase [Firmicutes bacterium HGW-Firmicutes-10]|jgi:amidohydrolase|nr:MAG: amidohydrolase [Firmicutes bacterium HGW-Firmicutes-10]